MFWCCVRRRKMSPPNLARLSDKNWTISSPDSPRTIRSRRNPRNRRWPWLRHWQADTHTRVVPRVGARGSRGAEAPRAVFWRERNRKLSEGQHVYRITYVVFTGDLVLQSTVAPERHFREFKFAYLRSAPTLLLSRSHNLLTLSHKT